MSDAQIISGNQLCFDKFEDADSQFKQVLHLLQKAGLYEALNTSTRVYSKLVREFYNNGEYKDGVLSTQVKGISIQLKSKEVNRALGFVNDGLTSLNDISATEGLKRMRHHKNPQLHGLKKKEFPQKYEFLADVIGKCILCKDSAHDSVNDTQLKIMTAVVKRIQLNFGALLLNWVGKRIQEKSSKKMFFGRFLSILLKKILKDQIKETEGEMLNVNKMITQKLFTNWTRNPGEQLKSRQSGESADALSEGQKSSSQRQLDQEESEDPHYVALIRKGKRQIEEVHQSTEDLSQGSAALPFFDQPPSKKQK